jgi:hypothetical protein
VSIISVSKALFRWLPARQVVLQYRNGYPLQRARNYRLACNACDEVVISGAPYNGPGMRYFPFMCKEACLEHLKEKHPELHREYLAANG